MTIRVQILDFIFLWYLYQMHISGSAMLQNGVTNILMLSCILNVIIVVPSECFL